VSESDVDDDGKQVDEVSVDSGDNQPSADVGSVDLCEVWMIRSDCQRDTRQIIVPCGHQRFCGSCITKIEEEGRGCPMCRAPIIMILRLFNFFCSRITVLSITVFSDICLPHVRPICNFAVQQSLRLCRPFYFGLSINKLGVAYV